MCIKDPINKRCWKNGKDLSNGAPKIKLWNHAKKTHFPVLAKNFCRPWMKFKNFFCHFPNPWTLRVSGIPQNVKKSQNHCTLMGSLVHAGTYCCPTEYYIYNTRHGITKIWVLTQLSSDKHFCFIKSTSYSSFLLKNIRKSCKLCFIAV